MPRGHGEKRTRKEEAFVCIWLDAQHRAIAIEEPFRGTLTQTSVYPREIVKAALRANAAAVIFAHNHPSGDLQPSDADLKTQEQLMQAAKILGIRVLDHVIISKKGYFSFQEAGLIA